MALSLFLNYGAPLRGPEARPELRYTLAFVQSRGAILIVADQKPWVLANTINHPKYYFALPT